MLWVFQVINENALTVCLSLKCLVIYLLDIKTYSQQLIGFHRKNLRTCSLSHLYDCFCCFSSNLIQKQILMNNYFLLETYRCFTLKNKISYT